MLDDLDRKILDVVQEELPLAERPYQILAARLGIEEDALLARLTHIQQQGLVRRIGAFFDGTKLGHVSVLTGVETAPDKLAAVAAMINSFPGVTHNYEREHRYNLWFTLVSPDAAAQDRILKYIGSQPGVLSMVTAPQDKRYKVHVRFTI